MKITFEINVLLLGVHYKRLAEQRRKHARPDDEYIFFKVFYCYHIFSFFNMRLPLIINLAVDVRQYYDKIRDPPSSVA